MRRACFRLESPLTMDCLHCIPVKDVPFRPTFIHDDSWCMRLPSSRWRYSGRGCRSSGSMGPCLPTSAPPHSAGLRRLVAPRHAPKHTRTHTHIYRETRERERAHTKRNTHTHAKPRGLRRPAAPRHVPLTIWGYNPGWDDRSDFTQSRPL